MSGLNSESIRGTQINKYDGLCHLYGQLCFRNFSKSSCNIGALKKAPSVSDGTALTIRDGLENFSNTDETSKDENAIIGDKDPVYREPPCKIDQNIQIFSNPMSIPTEQSSIQKAED